MFVELANGVEGLVHISSLMDDYYDYVEERYALVGEHTGRQYRLGDTVRIEVLQVSIEDVTIDFIMAGENASTREYIREQLQSKQSHASASQHRASKEKFRKEFSFGETEQRGSKKKKGSKNREPGRRSGKHEKPPTKGRTSKSKSRGKRK